MRINKLLLILTIFSSSYLYGAINQLNDDKVDTYDEVFSINRNFQDLYYGKLDLRPGDVIPRKDDFYNLGSSAFRWKRIYTSSGIAFPDGTFLSSAFGTAGATGLILPAAQYSVGYYSDPGSTTTISGDSNFTYNTSSVTVSVPVGMGTTTPISNFGATILGLTVGQNSYSSTWNSDQGGIHIESPFDKASVTSGGYGAIKIFSNDTHASTLQGTLALITSATTSMRGVTLESIEQGTAYRSLFLNPNGGYVSINSTSAPIGSSGLGLQIHQATDKNLIFDTGGVTLTGATGISSVNDANSANVPIEVRASAVAFTAGSVAIGNLSPTAKLNIAAGGPSIGEAPLRFTSGTVLAAPVGGAVEYDGTTLYLTQETGPTRRNIAMSTGTLGGNQCVETDANGLLTGTGSACGSGSGSSSGTNCTLLNDSSSELWAVCVDTSGHLTTTDLGASPLSLTSIILTDSSSATWQMTVTTAGNLETNPYP